MIALFSEKVILKRTIEASEKKLVFYFISYILYIFAVVVIIVVASQDKVWVQEGYFITDLLV